MKIAVVGAGNVGSLTAMRLAQEKMGEIILVDVVKGLAQGKAYDLEDASAILKYDYSLLGTDDFSQIKDADIVVVTAGLARKPGMAREELLVKNAQIVRGICLKVRQLAKEAIVIMVTNPLDLMTYLALEITTFIPQRVFGMGMTLDAARFTKVISRELNIADSEIQAMVIASHGEGMLPLPRFTTIRGLALDKFVDANTVRGLVKNTVGRGAEIVSLLGSGSAYFAPSAAIAEIVRAIIKDEKRILGLSVYLSGEYGLHDLCIGCPCRVGKNGIEEIIQLDLIPEEKEALQKSAAALKNLQKLL